MAAPVCPFCRVSTREVEGEDGAYECRECEQEFDEMGRPLGVPTPLPPPPPRHTHRPQKKRPKHARIDGPYFPA